MTTENLPAVAQYTVAGAGPYAVGHEYTSGSLVVTVVLAGVATVLAAPDYTVAPDSGASGTVTLTTAIATTYAGAALLIDRNTDVEQGWGSNGTPREDALEAQLDRTVQGQQDLKRKNTRVLQLPIEATGISPVIPAPVAGALLISKADATGWENGPDATDIAAAQANAAAAAASFGAFQQIWLGAFAAAPVTDNLGGPLVAGMVYVNTTTGFAFSYNGSAWVQAGAYTHPNHTGDVTSAGDGATTIAANAVTLAKIQDIPQGKLLGRITAGSGIIEELSSAQFTPMINFATTAGRGAVLQATQAQAIAGTQAGVFADVVDVKTAIAAQTASGSGLIGKLTASASTELIFTALDATKYGNYTMRLANILLATDTATVLVQFSTDGGSTWDSGATSYSWMARNNSSAGAVISGSAGDSSINLVQTAGGNALGNAAGEPGLSGTVEIYGPDLAVRTQVAYTGAYKRATDGLLFVITGAGVHEAAIAVNAIRVFPSSGNITSGEVTLTGMLKV